MVIYKVLRLYIRRSKKFQARRLKLIKALDLPVRGVNSRELVLR